MKANEVKNMKWIHVEDWSELSMSFINCGNETKVVNLDIDCFVENVFRDVARKLNIPYNELAPILKEENIAFYSIKAKIFQVNTVLDPKDSRLLKLEKMLRIPDVTAIDNNVTNVEKLLIDFSKLNDLEKLEALQRLSVVSINVEFFTK